MKKYILTFLIPFFIFLSPIFSEKYITEQSASYKYDKEPVSTIESVFIFDDYNYLKSFERKHQRGNQITTYDYKFSHANDDYIIKLKKTNDYINSNPNEADIYKLSKINGKWTLLYENKILGYFSYSDKEKKCSFIDSETNEEDIFYEYKNGKHILFFNEPYEYSLKNNIYYRETLGTDKKSKVSYNFKNEKYDVEKTIEGLVSKSTFSRNYYCTNFEQVCVMWIARYNFGGELLPYLFCKLDRAYHATSYLTESDKTYEPEHLEQKDGLPWASGNGNGIRDVISIKEFEHKNPTELVIMNGYQDKNHPDYYEKNSRVKTLKITNLQTKKSKSITVKDIKDEQRFTLSELGEGNEYDFEILAFYDGSKYNDLCIQYLIVE